ncbi:MAG: DUF554 domain-containing protein [Oscillospiraceae bacterium]|nr:DUF554 domain-containing protein [Oscillospiraceae bacterium]
MIGTLVNTGTILIGSLIGGLLKKGIKDKYRDALYNAMGLAAIGIGVNSICTNMPKSEYPVLFIVSLALGSLLGNIIDIDKGFNSLVGRFSKKESENGAPQLGQGLSTGILMFCIGTLSILGPINAALYGDNTFLFTNATLDLVTSMALASTYGFGMMLAAGVLFLWQGGIYLCAGWLAPVLNGGMMTEISLVGGFLIAASGISILGIKNMKTINMLPALLVPPIWFALKAVFGF